MKKNDAAIAPDHLLSVRNVFAGYGKNPVLHDVSLHVDSGEVVSLIGANGAGKTTLMSAILGRLSPTSGTIEFSGDVFARSSSVQKRIRTGLALVPEGREPLKSLTAHENLVVARSRSKGRGRKDGVEEQLQMVYDLFPRLKERRTQQAGSMSGGEQQMLAIGRALMSQPELLMLDEPSLGLAPAIVDSVFEALGTLQASGLSMLLVEQDAFLALEFSSRAYVLNTGVIELESPSKELLENPMVMKSYLGMG